MSDPHRTLFVSLARGGSRRLSGKNLRTVGGVPLVGRAVRDGLRAARQLGNLARVVVSADDESIAHAARQWGAEVPFLRPAELATDAADSVAALRHAVDWFARRGETFTEVVLLQPTSPLREHVDVIAAVMAFRAGDGSSVVTVRAALDGVGKNRYALDGVRLVNADPIATDVELNGAVYVCAPEWLTDPGRLCVPGRTIAVTMPAERSVDVDTPDDLRSAQRLYEGALLWKPDRCLLIAEAGVNHNGSLETALRLADAARDAGADAVKFQTFAAERLVTRQAAKAAYQKQTTSADESQFDMLKRLELSAEDHRVLKDHCVACGIDFISSPFGEEDVDLLDKLDVRAIKVGSGEITNHPLLTHIGRTLRSVILSTGCSTLAEVAQAVGVLRSAGCAELALLHCVSSYPADIACANLRAMATMREALGVPVGYSDHSVGIEVACAAVAMGARIVEKHLTLDRSAAGPDHRASLEPAEFSEMVSAIRRIESALGDGVKRPAACEADTRVVARRSLVTAANLVAGTTLQPEHLAAKRPGSGIPPSALTQVLGRSLRRDLGADELLDWADISGGGDG